ncbi:hypothetical protein RJ640_014486 [Escallonia rubra]|uniref:TIR domain-containing protein n=1 Tax=Escallonia rubra TaxID=112253 RepID=A0AA88UHT7_9ASTE|nr:hypothetical protein RJ640_014486 [Escallonia rubra]
MDWTQDKIVFGIGSQTQDKMVFGLDTASEARTLVRLSEIISTQLWSKQDNNEKEGGGNLKREVDKAIKGSQTFSKDYATSKWCLDELVMILDCKDTSRHAVSPIFYDVEPSEV